MGKVISREPVLVRGELEEGVIVKEYAALAPSEVAVGVAVHVIVLANTEVETEVVL